MLLCFGDPLWVNVLLWFGGGKLRMALRHLVMLVRLTMEEDRKLFSEMTSFCLPNNNNIVFV